MSATVTLTCLVLYFAVLMTVAYFTGRNTGNESFFLANRKSPWYLIAFGMLGSSISGVTFISVPGWVKSSGFSYYEMVLGYVLGYWIIAWVLMPVYYRLKLTSIYTYLDTRFGVRGYKTGSIFFLISRITGAAFRLYVAVEVLQISVFSQWHIPFMVNASVLVGLIWLYTRKGGMKTIIWTDALQTCFLLAALIGSICIISQHLHLDVGGLAKSIAHSPYSNIFNWHVDSKYYFFKQFLAGVFIAVAMTGLDQDMMQKNLTCKTLGDSQKNIIAFSIVQAVVVFFFLVLGVLLYSYAAHINLPLPAKSDDLYPILATGGYLGTGVAFLFVMGLIAASFASSDSALTALTTSFCVDILNVGKQEKEQQIKTRKWVHIAMALSLVIVIIIYEVINNPVVINAVFTVAAYTYGPLLGLYAFGLLTTIKINDKWIPYVCVISPCICYVVNAYSAVWFNGYKFGFELLILNALLTFTGLMLSVLSLKRKDV